MFTSFAALDNLKDDKYGQKINIVDQNLADRKISMNDVGGRQARYADLSPSQRGARRSELLRKFK